MSETSTLPLSGTIPDMTATTEQYVLLQQVYQTKARADLQRFTDILQSILKVSDGCVHCVQALGGMMHSVQMFGGSSKLSVLSHGFRRPAWRKIA